MLLRPVVELTRHPYFTRLTATRCTGQRIGANESTCIVTPRLLTRHEKEMRFPPEHRPQSSALIRQWLIACLRNGSQHLLPQL